MRVVLDKKGNGDFCDLTSLSEFINNFDGESLDVEFTQDEHYGELNLVNLKMQNLKIDGKGSVITGKNVVEANFNRYDDNKIVANIGAGRDFERLMLANKNMVLARYPKFKEGVLLNGCCSFSEINEKSGNWPIGTRGFLRSLHINEWGGNNYRFDKNSDKLELTWVGDNNRGKDFDKNKVIIEGVFEELSSANEWYYNALSGDLFFYCPNNFVKEMQVGLLDKIELLTIVNSKNTNILIDNFNFFDSERSTFKGKWNRYLRSDWAFNDRSAVKLNNCKNVEFFNCDFKNLGATAILIENNCSDIVVDNCNFTDCLSNGVLILGDKDSTYCSSSWENDNHITQFENEENFGAKTENYPKNISVTNSYFYNLGIEDKQSCAVCISLARNVRVENCTVHHLPRAGINICENAFGGHKILGNDIFDCVRETGDHGPFNSWGRDRFWSVKKFTTMGKYGKLKRNYFKADMLEKNIIASNRVVGEKGFGIDLDDGSSWYEIENNLCVGVGIKLREGFDRKVRNNIIVNAPLDLHATFARNNDEISNNIVYNTAPLNIVILNRGFTTKMSNNYFAGCSKGAVKNKISKKDANSILDLSINDVLNQDFSIPKFEKLPTSFGKIGAPQPSILGGGSAKSVAEYQSRGSIFKSIDETLRSLCGLPDYNGAYIYRLGMINAFRRAGIVVGDVIVGINGQPILNAHDIEQYESQSLKEITIYRNQTKNTIKFNK